MCNLGRGIAQENLQKGLEQGLKQGRAEGRAESRFEDIRNLMDSLSLSLEQAMAALKIPVSDQPKYRALLQQP